MAGIFVKVDGTLAPINAVPGPAGLSAYDLWIAQGNTGTEADFLDSLSSKVFDALGFRFHVGSTPPPVAVVDGSPVLWITDGSLLTPVPVAPTAPTFDYGLFKVTPPSVVGVEYQIQDPSGSWVLIPPGSATDVSAFPRPFELHVRAVAKPGYTLITSAEWSVMFYDPSTVVLWASDDFTGVPGVPLGPPSGAAGRAFNNALGGTASPAPHWSTWVSLAAIGPDGASLYHNPAYPNEVGHSAGYDTARLHWVTEIDVATWVMGHSRTISLDFGVGGGIFAGFSVFNHSTQIKLRFNTQAGMVAEYSYRATSPTPEHVQGTWRATWFNKHLQVAAPDGQVFNHDFSGLAGTFGTRGGVGAADFSGSPKSWAVIDGVRIYA